MGRMAPVTANECTGELFGSNSGRIARGSETEPWRERWRYLKIHPRGVGIQVSPARCGAVELLHPSAAPPSAG